MSRVRGSSGAACSAIAPRRIPRAQNSSSSAVTKGQGAVSRVLRTLAGGELPLSVAPHQHWTHATRESQQNDLGRDSVWVSSWTLQQLALSASTAAEAAVETEGHRFFPANSVADFQPLLNSSPVHLCRRFLIPITPSLKLVGPSEAFSVLRAAMRRRLDRREKVSPLWLPVELAASLREYTPHITPEAVVSLHGTLRAPHPTESTRPSSGSNAPRVHENQMVELAVVSAADVSLSTPHAWRRHIAPGRVDNGGKKGSEVWSVSLEAACLFAPDPVVYATRPCVPLPPRLGATAPSQQPTVVGKAVGWETKQAAPSLPNQSSDKLLAEEDILRLKLAHQCRHLASPYWFTLDAFCATVAPGNVPCDHREMSTLSTCLEPFCVAVNLREDCGANREEEGWAATGVGLYNMDDIQRACAEIRRGQQAHGASFANPPAQQPVGFTTTAVPRNSEAQSATQLTMSSNSARTTTASSSRTNLAPPPVPLSVANGAQNAVNAAAASAPRAAVQATRNAHHAHRRKYHLTVEISSDVLSGPISNESVMLVSHCGGLSVDLIKLGATLVSFKENDDR